LYKDKDILVVDI